MKRFQMMALMLAAGAFAGLAMLGSAHAGVSAIVTVAEESETDSKTSKQVKVECEVPSALRSGGGARIKGAEGDVALIASQPVRTSVWRAKAVEVNRTSEEWQLTAYAICLDN